MYKKVILLVLVASVHTSIARDEFGMKFVMRIYEDCQRADGILPCLKKKAILFFDRAARMQVIPLMSGIEVVKTADPGLPPVSENEIDATLARSLENKDQALSGMLWDRIATFANSRTIQLSMPKISGEDLNRGVEEGRGKMKKMMGMMMSGAMMKMAATIPLAIGALFILAGKALIISKIALLLAGIIALKKIIAQKNGGGGGGGGHESHGWSSGGGGGHGGYDRRSYNDASDLAYSAYKTA